MNPAKISLTLMAAFCSPVRKVVPLRPGRGTHVGADVSATVRLDARGQDRDLLVPEDAWTTIENTDAVYVNRPAASPTRCHIRGPAGVSMA
jgi:hypothetical protein